VIVDRYLALDVTVSELAIESFYPADAATAAELAALAARTAPRQAPTSALLRFRSIRIRDVQPRFVPPHI
jgi:hypothetical protein